MQDEGWSSQTIFDGEKLYPRCTQHNTDYILVREKDLECACKALERAGYDVTKS